MADLRRTDLKGSPERKHREAESYFTSQASGSTSRSGTSRPGLEKQNTGQFRAHLSTIRSPPSPGPVSPGAPRTPVLNRSFSTPFASPRADFSAGDETVVLELGSRYLRIGLGGEKRPRCIADFGPYTQRRAGDYRRWLPHSSATKSTLNTTWEDWGKENELWQMDLRNIELSLVRDKVERAIRDAMTQHVLILDDTRKRPQMVAVPSRIPQPLLRVILEALFGYSPPPPSIYLITIPVLSVVSAGLRSGLVIDIGWRSTTMTAVYEYREIKHTESTCAMKTVHWELAQLLNSFLHHEDASAQSAETEASAAHVSFEDSENILYRLAWCRSTSSGPDSSSLPEAPDGVLSVPLISSPAAHALQVPVSALSQPVDSGLFASEILDPDHVLDDNDLPLPLLAYRTLLSLTVDIRSQLINRVIITGGGANIPGVKERLLCDLANLIKQKKWDPVHNYGSINPEIQAKKTGLKTTGPKTAACKPDGTEQNVTNKDVDPTSMAPAHLQQPLPDPVLSSIQSRAAISAEEMRPGATLGPVRGVETLGAWAGASLMAGLRVKGVVEIERERFLQHGLYGAIERDEDTKHKRQSMMPGPGSQAKTGDRHSGNWTLGVFG